MLEEEEFDSSPRPVKKRRVTTTKTTKDKTSISRSSRAVDHESDNGGGFIVPDDVITPIVKAKRGRPKKVINDSDDDASIVPGPTKMPRAKRKSKDSNKDADGVPLHHTSDVKKPQARKKRPTATVHSDEDGSNRSPRSVRGKSRTHTPFDEYDDDGFAKPPKPKYAMHIPTNLDLQDTYLEPNAPPPSTNPWEIRGAIWKKDLPAVRSVFDVPAPKPRPSVHRAPSIPAEPDRGDEMRPPPSFSRTSVPYTQARPTHAQFLAPRPTPLPAVVNGLSDFPQSDDLAPEDWAHLETDNAKSPERMLGSAAQQLVIRPDSDAEADDWANLDAAEGLPTRRPTTAIERSGIPYSDDLDPEDWDKLDGPGVSPPKRPTSEAPDMLTRKLPSPHRTCDNLAKITMVAEPASPVLSPSTPESVKDSIVIDDLDPGDWSILENEHAKLPPAKSAMRKSGVITSSSRPGPVLSLDGRSHIPWKSRPQQSRPATKSSAPHPFIEVEDDSSEGVFIADLASIDRPLEVSSFAVTHHNQSHVSRLTHQKSIEAISSVPAAPVPDELADLPSDAFDDSEDDLVYVSSQHPAGQIPAGQIRKPNMVGPTNGLVQTTLFGGKAQPHAAVATANKKHAWPLATQREAETHHRLDPVAIKTWVYPTNLGTTRDYQYNIVARGMFHNLLVALPTGLGKTFIAATIMLNWFRWAPDSQIVFVAPTKPLVAQQIDACFKIVGIPRSETVLLTGETKPAVRAEEWKEKRVFFMTPQTIVNDLKHGYCDPKRIVLLVVDEAHRATGGYAYVEVVKFLRRFNQSFRVLALTATPGATVEAVQQVIDGLDISRVEIRTETSIDIRQYVHAREIDTMKFDLSEEQNLIMDLLSKAIQPVLNKLNGQNAYWVKDPMKLTAYGCNMAQRQWQQDAGRRAPGPIKGMVAQIFPVLASLGHAISLLKFHGIGSFHRSIAEFRNNVDGGMTKGKYALQIRQDENFKKMENTLQGWTRNPDFLGHPKLEYLRQVVLNHFMDSKTETRIMIFAHFRDSAEEIVRVMKRNEPIIRPHVFVGQASSKGSEGMGQKQQLEVIQQFKEGKYNTIVATSIGEEGLDIGEVDLIVCYDASASPIHMLQRMGRTGRKRKGNIVLLLMRGKEEADFEKAKDNYEKIQGMITDGSRFTFHDDKSPRILPKGENPVVDKRTVEIPIENSQADLPEPNRRKRVPKRPPKKFHMPDNVRTGFVSASRVDGSDDGEETPRPKATKVRAKKAVPVSVTKARDPTPEPEAAQLPFLKDVLLNKVQQRELERKYQYVNADEDDGPTVTAPRLDKLAPSFPGPTRLLRHGRGALDMAATMQRVRDMDAERVQMFKNHSRMSEETWNVDHLLADPDALVEENSDADLPGFPTLPNNKRIPKPVAAMSKSARARTGGKAAGPRTTATAKAKPGRGAARARQHSSDMEGDESEPEPTPASMRIGTQGIDLGSDDTSGEEDEGEGEPDSELAEFVVGSDAPIEMVSSSFPIMADELSDEAGSIEEVRADPPTRRRLQRRNQRALQDDSDD